MIFYFWDILDNDPGKNQEAPGIWHFVMRCAEEDVSGPGQKLYFKRGKQIVPTEGTLPPQLLILDRLDNIVHWGGSSWVFDGKLYRTNWKLTQYI